MIMPGKVKKPKSEEIQHNGVFIFPNGEKYDGDYRLCANGAIERNGQGTHSLSNGVTYTGEWKNDRMSGQGEMNHPNGSSYKGEFIDNEYHGSGVYTWADGSTYVGSFKQNRMSGQGEFSDVEGREWDGNFTGNTASGLKLKI